MDLPSCPEVIHTASERKGALSEWRGTVQAAQLDELTNNTGHGECLAERVGEGGGGVERERETRVHPQAGFGSRGEKNNKNEHIY